MSDLIGFRGRADGPAGLMLAINPASVALITSAFDRKYQQNVLRIHLNNSRIVKVYEADAEHVLETLGLGEYIGDWTLNLETDVEEGD